MPRIAVLSFLLYLLLSQISPATAQQRPVGYWRSHASYNTSFGVATDGTTIFSFSEKGFFTYNKSTGETETFSKVEGMHDVGVAQVAYDATSKTAVIGYQNSNIDLLTDKSFYNIPDLLLKSTTGSKTINHIYTDDGLAYISTPLGVLVLNLVKREVKVTYVLSRAGRTLNANAFTTTSQYFYVATSAGLFRTPRTNPIPENFATWQALDTVRNFIGVANVADTVFAVTADTVFASVAGVAALLPVFASGSTIAHIDAGNDVFYLTTNPNYPSADRATLRALTPAGHQADTTAEAGAGPPHGVVRLSDGSLALADEFLGLTIFPAGSGNPQRILPNGPNGYTTFGIWAYNKEVWIAHGAFDNDLYIPKGYRTDLSHFQNDTWAVYDGDNTPVLQHSADFVEVLKDQSTGTLYGGTLTTGLFVLKADGTAQLITKPALENKTGEPDNIPANGLAIDQNGALWVTQLGAADELAVMTKDGSWYHYAVDAPRKSVHFAAGIIVDDYNQKWYYAPQGGGVIVYNDNNTPDNGADDSYFHLTTGVGSGNLPSNNVHCLVKDRDGAIWIGTDAGIGIVNCPGQVIAQTCEAEQPPVQYDEFAGLLFSTETVLTMAVDGANRKWVGTNNGVWLISPDAQKIILRFTAANSPLPSDVVQRIGIDPVTGDVYIGTDAGLVSYHGTAVVGNATDTNVHTYPSPVPSGYAGTIAITGLTTDADVRITDISGQLVYRTQALGGQAVWSGLDYTGHRPASGVYLIFITNKDGTQTHVGKMLFMN